MLLKLQSWLPSVCCYCCCCCSSTALLGRPGPPTLGLKDQGEYHSCFAQGEYHSCRAAGVAADCGVSISGFNKEGGNWLCGIEDRFDLLVFVYLSALVEDRLVIHQVVSMQVLVFSKCIRAGFWAFSTSKYRVNGGTKVCNWWIILKFKTYLTLIIVVVVLSVYRYWVTNVWNDSVALILFFVFNKGHFLRLRVTRVIRHCSQILGHDILHYGSEFRRSERDN